MESRKELIKYYISVCSPGDNFIVTFHGLEEFKELLFEFRTEAEIIQVLNENPGEHNYYHVVFRRRV